MNKKLFTYFQKLKTAGLTPEREAKLLVELNATDTHETAPQPNERRNQDAERAETHQDGYFVTKRLPKNIYAYDDFFFLQGHFPDPMSYTTALKSLDELLERDNRREEDGFPRKIRVGKLVKPGKGGKNNVVVVPTTVEEKFIHDPTLTPPGGGGQGGSGDGEEGEIIGEQPIRSPDASGEGGPGEGEGGAHELESSAYDLGKVLTEQFQLPNLKDKGKKRSLTRYTYDMTDRHRGFGQILDKKATLRKIVETNISLGNLTDIDDIDPTRFLISPRDMIYRILSREKDYESQAMVFFLRDYSGSMVGKATSVVVAQHVLIYSWLFYQYSTQVESRFILHDTEAKEVEDFYTYYNSKVAGGTKVSSAYHLVNEIVEKDKLDRDYNIYIFHGTDGDDWDTDGKEAIPELEKILTYANRVGITIAEHKYGAGGNTEVEKYIKKTGLLTSKPALIRMDVMPEDAEEQRIIEGIKKLISE